MYYTSRHVSPLNATINPAGFPTKASQSRPALPPAAPGAGPPPSPPSSNLGTTAVCWKSLVLACKTE